jgi:hypothetical protein
MSNNNTNNPVSTTTGSGSLKPSANSLNSSSSRKDMKDKNGDSKNGTLKEASKCDDDFIFIYIYIYIYFL